MKDKKEKAEHLLHLMTECSSDIQKKAFEADSAKMLPAAAGKAGNGKKLYIALIAAVLAAAMVFGGFWGFRNRGQHGIPEVPRTNPVPVGTVSPGSSPSGDSQTESPDAGTVSAGTEESVPPIPVTSGQDSSRETASGLPEDTAVPGRGTDAPIRTTGIPPVQTASPAETTAVPPIEEGPMKMVSLAELYASPVQKTDTRLAPADFDRRLIDYISQNAKGNYMVSPLSFRYALGLLLSGSRGETQAELLNALGVRSVREWNAYCAKCNGMMQSFEADFSAELADFYRHKQPGNGTAGAEPPSRAFQMANSIWKRNDLAAEFKESYKLTIGRYYGAEFSTFSRENAVQKINQWARDKTSGIIDPFLPDNYNTDNLALVLMNALYFKDTWVTQFNEETHVLDFFREDGTVIQKRYMDVTASFSYYDDGETQAVVLPMAGNVRMAVVLGNPENLPETISMTKQKTVHVTMPILDIETKFDTQLLDFLMANGVKKAFTSGEADFGDMLDFGSEGSIYVDEILQRTKIKTSTGGVEAAATTAISLREKATPDSSDAIEFTADKPFSFFIYSTADDITAMLFAGEMVE